MSRNGHVWAETQEVAFVGLLVLRAVRHRAHATHRQQRLAGGKTENKVRLAERASEGKHFQIILLVNSGNSRFVVHPQWQVTSHLL